MARQVLEATGVRGGVVVHVDCGDGRLTAALRADDAYLVHGLDSDAKNVEAARRHIRSLGLYGPVSVQRWAGGVLPYPDNFVNLLVLGEGCKVPTDEIERVLVPNGVAISAPPSVKEEKARLVKPWPAEMDQWTHHLHGPDGNPVAKDRLVGPPARYQWLSEPPWQRCHDTDSSISAVVTANGRIFYIEDQAPISTVGQHALPDRWFLVARDAFNGVPLWKRPIEHWGWREWKKSWFQSRLGMMPLNLARRLVAVGDRVYVTLGYHAPVSQLDAATGETVQTYQGTENTYEILCHDGALILSVNRGGKLNVLGLEAKSGVLRWETQATFRGTTNEDLRWGERFGTTEAPELDPASNLSSDGRLICLIDGSELVGLDFQTGKERWRASPVAARPKRGKTGDLATTHLMVGTVIVTDKAVLYADPRELVSLSSADGKKLWSKGRQGLGFYSWKDVFVIRGLAWTWSVESDSTVYGKDADTKREMRSRWPLFVNGYDLVTGEMKAQVNLSGIFKAPHHHRCYQNKATDRFIVASRRGSEFVDLESGRHSVNNWVRGTCHLGMLFANGLQYAPPSPCACYIQEKLNGFNALAPAGESRVQSPESRAEGRLERGPAFGLALDSRLSSLDASDWPTFRHDASRSGSISAALPVKLSPVWTAKLGGKVTPAVIADGKVFVAEVDRHCVVALDASNGKKLWDFTAGARVDSPPTFHNGLLLFGSRDGWAYCLRARDGDLAWRFRAAPAERLIGAFGQLESAWPVHGSVLVQKGVAYFAAGRSSHLDGGICLYGVDPASGKLLHQARLEGPHMSMDTFQDNFATAKDAGFLTDILVGDGERISMRGTVFDAKLTRLPGSSVQRISAAGGMLDDSYFKRITWAFGGGRNVTRAQLLVCDDRALYGVQMLSPRCLDPNHFFTPGKDGYTLQCQPLAWMSPVKVANSKSLNPAGRPLTVAAWVNAEKPDGVILARGGSAAGYALVLRGGKPQFTIRAGEKTASVNANAGVVGRWAHVAGVLTAEKQLRVYLDGQLAGSAEAGMFCGSPGQAMEIGADAGTAVGDYESPYSFSGVIDEVRVYPRALGEAEIRDHAAGPLAAKDAALYFSFDHSDARDESGNDNHGDATPRQIVDGKFGKAMQFSAATGGGWSQKATIRVQAMVAASNVLVVAGPPDLLDLAAFDGRAGGVLRVLAAADGKQLAEYRLDAPPVFNGLAAGAGRVFLSATKGDVTCLAGRGRE